MSGLSAVTMGLSAALRLARGRGDGAALVQSDRAGVARSFWAIPFCIPAVVCLLLISWSEAGIPVHAGHVAAQELLTFVLNWLIFVEVSHRLVPLLGRGERWGRFVALWNWCNVAEQLLVLIGAIPGLLGAPPIVDQACTLIVFGWALWLEWFATRIGLDVGGFTAAWLVVLDQSIGIVLVALASILAGH